VGVNIAAPVNDFEYWAGVLIYFVIFAIKIFAFVTAMIYSAESYVAADKLNKPTWALILGVAILLQVVPLPLSLINLGFLVAACVYLADVRPALSALRRR
jgi:cytosine/uracil/thiamine/allantoin permease